MAILPLASGLCSAGLHICTRSFPAGRGLWDTLWPYSAKGEVGRVVRVIDGDALVLDTGLVVRLAGIEAPSPERRGRRGQPYADTSARVLE
ncbi:MAG: hypothetical protein AAGJ29_08095, partial [Pseudomonadota bacterium]